MLVKEVDRAALIQEEVNRVLDFFDHNPGAIPLGGSVHGFVEYCYNTHERLIQIWGGWEYAHGPVQAVRVADADLVKVPRPDDLTNLAYFQTKLWERDDMECWYTDTLYVRIRRGQTISKAILGDLRKRFGKGTAKETQWERFFEALGQRWATLTPIEIVLSARPSHFLHLGGMGENTCYRVGGENERSKYHLAQLAGSVVVLFFPPDADHRNLENVSGRAWGVLGAEGALFSNIYLLSWNRCLEAVHSAASAVLSRELSPGQPRLRTALDKISHEDLRHIYINDDTHHYYAGESPTAFLLEINEYVRDFLADATHFQDEDGEDDDDDDWRY